MSRLGRMSARSSASMIQANRSRLSSGAVLPPADASCEAGSGGDLMAPGFRAKVDWREELTPRYQYKMTLGVAGRGRAQGGCFLPGVPLGARNVKEGG